MEQGTVSWFSKFKQNIVEKISVKSALNPMLYLLAVSCIFLLPAAYVFREDPYIKYPLVYIIIIEILITVAMYIYFAFNKTDKLQSEDYQIRSEALQLIKKKGNLNAIDPNTVHAIANPRRNYQLTPGDNET